MLFYVAKLDVAPGEWKDVAWGQLIGFAGRHGAMNPAGKVRCNMWNK